MTVEPVKLNIGDGDGVNGGVDGVEFEITGDVVNGVDGGVNTFEFDKSISGNGGGDGVTGGAVNGVDGGVNIFRFDKSISGNGGGDGVTGGVVNGVDGGVNTFEFDKSISGNGDDNGGETESVGVTGDGDFLMTTHSLTPPPPTIIPIAR